MQTKRILRALLSLALVVYLIFASLIAGNMAQADTCRGMTIVVNDTSSTPFVTARELARELHGLPARAPGMRLSSIDTDSLRAILQRIDKIEHVTVVRRTDGTILITVDPMRPVARIFDGGHSYYINREGKRISADARYHIDVPVIDGHFNDTVFAATELLPLLDWLDAHEKWGTAVSMIKVASPHDVMLIPAFRGHVINLGEADPASLDNKFARLDRMYEDVIPLKGWQYYDTISVKWSGQVVATRRDKSLPDMGYVTERNEEEVDVTTMRVADEVAPGQAIEGRKAKNDKPVPKASTASEKPQPEKSPETPDTIKTKLKI